MYRVKHKFLKPHCLEKVNGVFRLDTIGTVFTESEIDELDLSDEWEIIGVEVPHTIWFSDYDEALNYAGEL